MTTPPPAPPPPRRDGEATRRRLLRAALELYTDVGLQGTTTPALARRAGVAEGTIYRHFTGKEHLFNEAYREVQRWAAALARESEGDRTLRPGDRLARLGRRLVETAAADPPTARMLLRCRDERHLDEPSRAAAREFRGVVEAILAGGTSDGVVRVGPAELWAAVWLELVGLAVERVAAGEWTAEHSHVALTLDAAWDAVAVKATIVPPPPIDSAVHPAVQLGML